MLMQINSSVSKNRRVIIRKILYANKSKLEYKRKKTKDRNKRLKNARYANECFLPL